MCDTSTTLPTFTARRTNRVPLEFRDDSDNPVDLTSKTLRLRYWIAETQQFVFEQELASGNTSGNIEFIHPVDAFDFPENTTLGWILDILEGPNEDLTIDPWAQGTVLCHPVPPAPSTPEDSA